MTFYLASDHPLPLIPWQEQHPGFHVTQVPERERSVIAQFTKPHVYYVGSHEQCGCGFEYDEEDYGRPDYQAAAKQSVADLRRYLESALAQGGSAQLYACWDGEWSLSPAHRLDLTTAAFGGASFCLPERTLATIVSGAA